MKYLFLFCILVFALPGFGQRGEVVKDTIFFSTAVNECGDTVWQATETVQLRGGRVFTNTQAVGFSENDPCSGIRFRDTAGLKSFFFNPLIDYGRQQAAKAKDFIFQSRSLRTFDNVDRAIRNARLVGIYRTVERLFADSLVGNYILVRPSVANASVRIVKTSQGDVRVRLAANSFLPIVVYSDTWISVRNIAGANQDVDLYQIEPGRWVSLLGNYQLVKNVRQVVVRGVK